MTQLCAVQEDFHQHLRKVITDKMAGFKSAGNQGKLAGYLPMLPDMHCLLVKMADDNAVEPGDRAIIARALSYHASPFDIIPDMLFPLGLFDDLVISATLIRRLTKNLDNITVIQRYWPESGVLFEAVTEILALADVVLGEKVMQKIRSKFS